MTEQTEGKHKPHESHIPEDVRKHMRAAHDEMRKSVETLLPPGFREHHRKARKEVLMAWRGMIDHAIKRIDEHEKKES